MYFEWGTVKIEAAPDATQAYVQGARTLRTIRCRHCGCVTHWEPISAEASARHSVHLGNYLAREGVDVAIRSGSLARVPGHVQTTWFKFPWVVCASPAYLQGRQHPRQPADLAGHQLIG